MRFIASEKTTFFAIGLFVVSVAVPTLSAEVIEEREFTTTFSDYNQLDKMITCIPGFQGGFATADTIKLKNHTIELGYEVGHREFEAADSTALNNEPSTTTSRKRPYELGCVPALKKFKKALEGLDLVEVTVHRKLGRYDHSSARVHRNRSGEVNFVKRVSHDYLVESYRFNLGGLDFRLVRGFSGETQ